MAADTLTLLGWTKAYATTDLESRHVHGLIEELKSGNHAHSWREFSPSSPDSAARDMLAFENRKRPSRVLGFYGVTVSGERVFFGAAAISDGISNSFPHAGFPVVSRCYILEKYRERRLYAPVLLLRVRLCERLYGDDLKAIHLGTANERVYQTIKSNLMPVKFVYLGNESLQAGTRHLVRDFLHLTPRFERDLKRAVEWPGGAAPESVRRLQRSVDDLVSNRFDRTGYHQLRLALEGVKQETGWEPARLNLAVKQLLAMFEAIPVIRDATPEPREEPVHLAPRRAER